MRLFLASLIFSFALLCESIASCKPLLETPIPKPSGSLIEIVSDKPCSWVAVEPMDLVFRVYESNKVFVTTAQSMTGIVKVLQFTPGEDVATPTIKWHIFSVGPPPSPEPVVLPTAKLTAEPPDVKPGESTTLTWATTDATSVKLDTGDGPKDVDANGSAVVLPRLPTNLYTIIASTADHTVYAQAVVSIGEKPPPIVPSKVDRVTYVWEKDKTAVPRPVAAALNKINADSGGKIIATELEVDTVNGQGQNPPAQYKIAHAAAVATGLPCLVVQAGDVVVRVVKDPKTLEAVLEAAK